MSIPSKATFILAASTSVGIIGYVHYKQQFDREKLHQGVLSDIEQQQMKKTQNLFLLEQQKHLEAKYKQAQKLDPVLMSNSQQNCSHCYKFEDVSQETGIAVVDKCMNKDIIWEGDNFQFCEILIQPKVLETGRAFYETIVQLSFKLTELQIRKLNFGRANCSNRTSNLQVLLRFCKIHSNEVFIDNYPNKTLIKINENHFLPRMAGPINISKALKYVIGARNTVTITYQPSSRLFVAVIFLAHLPNIQEELSDNCFTMVRDAEVTKEKIVDIFLDINKDSDLCITSFEVSLICPIGQKVIQEPCIGKQCAHIECFDMTSFFETNTVKPKWRCPICRKCCAPKSLLIDGYWKNIINELPHNCTSVALKCDGSWEAIINKYKHPKISSIDD